MFKILILDDNREILDVMSFVLTRKKMEVVAIHDPRKLTHCIADYKPDLLLMDIALGGFDGRDLCRMIKGDPEEYHFPVVLFSAQHYSEESIEECRADAVIDKPFALQSLYNTMNKFLH